MIKRLLLLLTILLPLAVQAQYVTLTGKIQASNGLNAADYVINFTPSQSFFIAGTGVVVNTSTSCGTTTDGTVVGTPDPLYPTVVTPQFTGTLPPSNYYVEYTFYTASGSETLPSPEIPVQLTSTGELTVASPSGGIPANAAGMRVYVASTSGAETLQGQTTGTGAFLQAVPLVAGSAPPSTNSTICQQVANDAGWPAGTGYNVTLVDPAGNTLPGYPMLWQLLGAGSTLNLSNGLPYYHGIVTFPSPILASPLNHAPQSISGPLNMQGYSISNVNQLTACQVNGKINAASSCFSQYADIGAKVNAALALCATQCTVYVPAGNYAFATTMQLPMGVIGAYKVEFDPAAVMTYSGSGDAVLASPTGAPSFANLTISGGRLIGTGGLGNGVHIVASSFINIDHMTITGFLNGLLLDGPNTVNVDHNFIEGNTNGIQMIPTFCNLNVCGPTPASGSGFTTNKITIAQNSIVQNFQWGILDSNTQPANTGSLGNAIENNDLENNGSAGPTFGAIQLLRGTGYRIEGNYFEGSPRQIVLGTLPLGSPFYFATQQTEIDGNYFTELIGTPYSIEIINGTYTHIENNATDDATMNASNCFVNVGTGSTAENHTLFGQNDVILSGGGSLLCQSGSAIQNFVGSGSYQSYNQNFNPRLVFGAFPITTASSDSVPAQFVTPTSACFATASNNGSQATAQGLIAQVYVRPSGSPGSATIFHPTGNAGLLYDIWCSGPQNL